MRDFTNYELCILNTIAFADEISYTDLNTQHLTTDLFTYHLKKLIKDDYIQKLDSGAYSLTDIGKNIVSKLDGRTFQIEEQCKTVVVVICSKVENDKTYYLLQKRSRQPLKDYYCLPGGKSRLGESLTEAVLRELKEETGLSGNPVLAEIRHTTKLSTNDKQILSDDIIYCYKIENLMGELIDVDKEGINQWFTVDEILKLDKLVKNTIESIKSIQNQWIKFIEEKHIY
jgi:8-oxo-dGTP diphosphatase